MEKKLIKRLKHSISWSGLALIVLSMFLAVSCDLFEEDALPADEKAAVTRHDFFILPNSAAVIDLKSIADVSEEMSITVSSQPQRGTLSKLGDAIFMFQPGKDFTSGKDRFAINFSQQGRLVKADSIYIVVGTDTTDFPCSLYAVQDHAYTMPGQPVSISHLANDRLCDISRSDLVSEIYYAPGHGQAAVSGDSIFYTPASGFEGTDQFVYKLSVEGDTIESFGLVSVLVGDDTCTVSLSNDEYAFSMDYQEQVTFSLNVISNDWLCDFDSASGEMLIVQQPNKGIASAVAGGFINYQNAAPFTEGYIDSLTYRICSGGSCSEALVTIHLFAQSCTLTAVSDSLDLRDSVVTDIIRIPVLANDELCGQNVSLDVSGEPLHGTAYVYEDAIGYLPDEKDVENDIITYELCGNAGCTYGEVYIMRK